MAHHPGCAAILSISARVCSGEVDTHGARINTSGAYVSTCSHRRLTAGAPGSCSSSTPPASTFISGNQCPPTASGRNPSRESTRGRRSAPATAAATARSLARSCPTSANAASSSPVAAPTRAMTSITSLRRCGSIASTPVRPTPSPSPFSGSPWPWLPSAPAPPPRRPALANARATTLSPGPPTHRSHASCVNTNPGRTLRSHSTSTDAPTEAPTYPEVASPAPSRAAACMAELMESRRPPIRRRFASFATPSRDRRTMGNDRATVVG